MRMLADTGGVGWGKLRHLQAKAAFTKYAVSSSVCNLRHLKSQTGKCEMTRQLLNQAINKRPSVSNNYELLTP
jgi:hypothetical protein